MLARKFSARNFAGLPVLDASTPFFAENSVQILSSLCAKTPLCLVKITKGVMTLGVTRFRDVDACLRNYGIFSSDIQLIPPVPGAEREATVSTLIRDDPPEHTRIRSLVVQAFSRQRVASMEGQILHTVRNLTNTIMDQGPEFELLSDFANQLPVTVIGDILGVEASDRQKFKKWSDDLISTSVALLISDETERTTRLAEIAQSAHEFESYLKALCAERRTRPGADVVSSLVTASLGNQSLNDEEIMNVCKLLLIAGNETTTRLISLAMNYLIRNPNEMAALSESAALAEGAVEETLRYEGTIFTIARVASEDCEIAGHSVPAGTAISLLLGAANHDKSVFENPEVFNIRRTGIRHLGFGGGIHQCLGAPLARLEVRIALEEFFSRMQDLEFTAPPVRDRSSLFRGFQKMRIAYKRREFKMPAREKQIIQEVSTAGKLAKQTDAELGLDKRTIEKVRVGGIRTLTPRIKLFRLVHPSGGILTPFTAGSHIVVHLQDGDHQYRNAYSLLNAEFGNGISYFIAVALSRDSRGGSRYMHEMLKPGMQLKVSVPANNFPAAEHAEKHLMIAGGIGITPIFALRNELRFRNQPCELHYAFRSASDAAFTELFEYEFDPNIRMYDSSKNERLNIDALVRRQPPGTHLYVCGPEGLMQEAIDAALRYGWPRASIHFERFGAAKPSNEKPFEVFCKRSGKTLTVPSDKTLLETIEAEHISLPFACRAGSCGACETSVLEGEVDHRDSIFSDTERAENKSMFVCVSRGKGRLVLEI